MNGIFPLAYFGSIAYFQALCKFDHICFEVHETYIKQSIRNRSNLVSSNGYISISIPVSKPFGSKTCTKDIQIADDTWGKQHLKTIKTNYGSAAYFDHYIIDLEIFYSKKFTFLLDVHEYLHDFIYKHLALPYQYKYTSKFENKNDFEENELKLDYENLFPEFPTLTTTSILDALMNLGPITRKLLIN